MKMHEAPGAREKDEVLRSNQTLDRVLTDKRKRYFFSRFLNADPKDQEIVKDIYEKYQKKEKYTDEQTTFLNDRLAEFRQRMVLVEEARMIFGPKELAQTAKGYEPLREIMALNARSPELLQEYLAIMAMENPASLRQILDVKRQINEKRRSGSYRWYDTRIQNILDRFNLSREDLDAVHSISDEGARKEHFRQLAAEKAGVLKKAIDFVSKHQGDAAVDQAYAELGDLERNALAQQIEDHQREIAEVIEPLLRGDDEVMKTIQFVRFREDGEGEAGDEGRWGQAAKEILRVFGKGAGEFAGQELEWAGSIANALFEGATGIRSGSGPHTGAEGAKKKKDSAEKEKEVPREEYYEDPEDLIHHASKRVGGGDLEGAAGLLKYNLVDHDSATRKSKRFYKTKLESLIKQKEIEAMKKAIKRVEKFLRPDLGGDEEDDE